LPLPPGDAPAGPFSVSSRTGLVAVITDRHVLTWDGTSAHVIPVANAQRLSIEAGGAHVAIATATEVSMWRIADGTRLWSAPLDVPPVQVVAIGDRVAVVLRSGVVRLVDAASAHDLGKAMKLAYGSTAAFAAIRPGGVDVWSANGEPLRSFEVPDTGNVAVSPDGKTVAVSATTGAITLYDVASGHPIGALSGHQSQARLAFTPDGGMLISAGEDQVVRVWSVANRGELLQVIGTGSGTTNISFDPAAKHAIVSSAGGVRVLGLTDPGALTVVEGGEPLGSGGFLHGGAQLFTTSDTGMAVWDASNGHRIARFETGPAEGTHFDDTATKFAVPLSDTPTTEIHDAASGKVMARITTPTAPAWVVFDHAGRHVVTMQESGAVDLWEVGGAHVRTFTGHEGNVIGAAFDPSDQRVATAGYADRTARIWDVATGRELGRVQPDAPLFNVAFDGSGDRLLTSGDSRIAALWDTGSFQQVRTFEHKSSLRDAAISHDGQLVAGAVRDGTVAIWDVASGKELFRFQHAQLVMSADFASDDRRLTTSSRDGHAIVWDLGRDVPDTATVAAFVACHAPYELRGTSLEVVELRGCASQGQSSR
jgi:WD40 repeat protein